MSLSTNKLEKLAFQLDERDIVHLARSLSILGPDMGQLTAKDLKQIMELKLNNSFYAFHEAFGWTEEEGVTLQQRIGSTTQTIDFESYSSYTVRAETVAEYARKNNITYVYTGTIPTEGFLGYRNEDTTGDWMRLTPLNKAEIHCFEEEGITIITLDKLV